MSQEMSLKRHVLMRSGSALASVVIPTIRSTCKHRTETQNKEREILSRLFLILCASEGRMPGFLQQRRCVQNTEKTGELLPLLSSFVKRNSHWVRQALNPCSSVRIQKNSEEFSNAALTDFQKENRTAREASPIQILTEQ